MATVDGTEGAQAETQRSQRWLGKKNMSNFMMYWRSAGLEQAIAGNGRKTRPQRNSRHVDCTQHSRAEVDAFERSLRKQMAPWQQSRGTLH